MIVKDNIETVWFIEDNKLKKANKIVSKINYNGNEIATLKQERNNYKQDFLFKDEQKEYWSMCIVGIEFNKFLNKDIEDINYCENVMKFLNEFDLKQFFSQKIENEGYFNKCELAYISKYYSEIYDMAKDSREKVIEKNNVRRQEEIKAREQEEQETVKKVNGEFKKKLNELKKYIYNGKMIQVIDLEFYKDGKYENGLTTQNCILYLAKQYGIDIPIATQGFINQRLTDYNFSNGKGYFKATSNKRCSQTMGQYLEQIYESVKKECKKGKECER